VWKSIYHHKNEEWQRDSMNFINLQVFWWIPVILIFMGLLFWRARVRRMKIMRIILGPRIEDEEHVQLSLARRLFRFFLLLAAMLMLIVAIARPTWKLKLVPYQSRGRDLMVLFDVSKSMLAQDIKPSRLAHAKLFLRDLVNETGSDRFGLVAFAGDAFLECPMTTDKASFIQYIDELDTSSIPRGGTNLELALQKAMEAFDAAEGNNRAIILITDGDELTGDSRQALAKLKKANIPLLIVGVGDSNTAAVIPVKNGNGVKYMRDKKDELVKTRLNAPLMQKLADSTGGCFVHSTTTNFGLDQIEAGIKKLLPEELEKGEKTRPIERFYYFLAFATILLWLWFLISEHPGKKHKKSVKALAAAILAILTVLPFSTDAQNAKTLPNLNASEKKKEEKEPPKPLTDAVKAYNQARDMQLKKKGDSSQLYETAINLADKNPAVRINSFNNLGVNEHEKARQAVMQGLGQVKQQNLDGAIGQLESAKKVLDTAEEMYVKALSTKPAQESQPEDKKVSEADARNQTALNQQLLLNDRAMIDELIKKIKELKKQQEKAQKQTQKAQKQQQKKNKQDKQDKQQKKDQKQNKQQKKQDQQKKDQKQNKQQKKQDQQKKDQKQDKQQKKDQKQDKQQKKDQKQDKQQKKDQKQDKQQKKDQKQNKQQKKQQKKQDQKQDQQKNKQDELKKAQDAVKNLEKQAKDLQQKKIEEQAQKAQKELKKAEDARKEKQGKKAEEHIKEALKKLQPQGSDKDKDKKKKDQKGQGKDQQQKKDQQKQDKKKDKDKQGKDKKDQKLPQQPPQAAQEAKAEKAPKDIDPKEARKLLKLMNEKEKDFRKALKAYRQQQYKNQEVEKDW
jgi:Ca-activated chloride channel family protein